MVALRNVALSLSLSISLPLFLHWYTTPIILPLYSSLPHFIALGSSAWTPALRRALASMNKLLVRYSLVCSVCVVA